MHNGLKIIIAVDDPVSRRMFSSMISGGDVKETLTAANCKIVLARLKQDNYDLILLDIGWSDCLDTIKTIYGNHPDTSVIVVSNNSADAGELIIEALECGAIDVLPKIDQKTAEPVIQDTANRLKLLIKICLGRQSLQMTKALIKDGLEKISRPEESSTEPFAASLKDYTEKAGLPVNLVKLQPRTGPHRFDVVIIGVSTGGPNALARVIPNLPADFKRPVLIVQHMPEFLTKHLATNLDQKSSIKVKEAVEGEELKPGIVYLAPGGKHMVVRQEKVTDIHVQKIITLSNAPPENSCRPSVDVLLASIAESYHSHALAIIMTGMGSDGLKGIRALKEKGGYCLSQTKETCAVYGMPRAVDEAGLSDERVPLENMAERMIALVQD